jgi:2-(acetamidomethylene)succinate hydrolase
MHSEHDLIKDTLCSIKSNICTVGSLSLFKIESGNGPLVILLHGITANAYIWEPVIEELAKNYRVVAIDQRGHGRSARPRDATYAAQDFASDVATLISSLSKEPAVIIGHSLGARNALVAGRLYPELVAGVVGIEFTPFIDSASFDALDKRVVSGWEGFSSLESVRDHLRAKYKYLPDEAIDRRAKHGFTVNSDGAYVPLANRNAIVLTSIGLREDLEPIVRDLDVPALLVRGSESRFISQKAFEKTRRLRPDLSTLVVAGADHYVPEEAPQTLARSIEMFISNLKM